MTRLYYVSTGGACCLIYDVYLSGCTSFRWMFPAFSRMGNNQSYPAPLFSHSVNHRIKDILILEYFKDKIFEALDEIKDFEIVDIDTDDAKNTFTIETVDGSKFEIECRKLV